MLRDFIRFFGIGRNWRKTGDQNNKNISEVHQLGGSLLVSQSINEQIEFVRLGQCFEIRMLTPRSTTTSLPTTTGTLGIHNGYPRGGKSLILDTIGCGSGTGTSNNGRQWSMIGQLIPRLANQINPNQTMQGRRLDGKPFAGTRARYITGAFGTAGNWFPIGSSQFQTAGTGTTSTPMSLQASVRGLYILPPGAAFLMAVHSSETALIQHWIRWFESYVQYGDDD